ncbi:MAG TPA: YggS family pyridoxal phosphate-dependent enzyme, partial [Dysgonamonadaceae bacterium]|nr:YggS family pyridoxal phosphate-dependent enzyme [Dysgonamonadaceae bacterium]
MSVRENIELLRRSVPENVKIVAVSKFHPVEQIREAYDDGQRIFGESRVQELVAKQAVLPDDIEWHFIGSLQRNKV